MKEARDSKFETRKWNIINDQSNANYHVRNEIIYTTEILKSNLCDYNYAYLFGIGNITIAGRDFVTELAFKNLDLVLPMYNLIKFSSNYSETRGSLWFYSKDEATNFNADIANTNDFKSFMYKAKL